MLGDLFLRQLSQVAGKLVHLHGASLVSSEHGSWLLVELDVQDTKAKAVIHFTTQAWMSHTTTSTVFCWSHRSALSDSM